MKTVTKFALIVLFSGCFFDVPYWYFQMIKTVCMTAFIWLYFAEKEIPEWKFIWFWSAVIIQPFLPPDMSRGDWEIFDAIWIVILLMGIFRDFAKKDFAFNLKPKE